MLELKRKPFVHVIVVDSSGDALAPSDESNEHHQDSSVVLALRIMVSLLPSFIAIVCLLLMRFYGISEVRCNRCAYMEHLLFGLHSLAGAIFISFCVLDAAERCSRPNHDFRLYVCLFVCVCVCVCVDVSAGA